MPDVRAHAQDLLRAARAATAQYSVDAVSRLLSKPVIVLSAPRAGSTLLFEQLARADGFWTVGGESHGIFRAFPSLRAENAALDSGRLDASHAGEEIQAAMRSCFLMLSRNHRGEPFLKFPPEQRPDSITLLEKTPRNALNVPFLNSVFPDARFVYLYRDARQNVASLIEAWTLGLQTGRFVTFSQLPGWDRPAWCFLLPPGWRSLVGKSLPEIAAFQWAETNRIVLDDLQALDRDRWCAVSYTELVEDPGATFERVCRFSGVDTPQFPAGGSLPLSRTTLTAPDPDKWRRHATELDALATLLDETEAMIASAVSAD
ncbi:MAG: sulfotransferase [Woeseiaceae bacterium]|nr:sulfotransferase [Woeseiaceae bacterium]